MSGQQQGALLPDTCSKLRFHLPSNHNARHKLATMKKSIFAIVFLALIHPAMSSDLRPVPADKLLFQVYDATPMIPDHHGITWSDDHLLMKIYSVQNLALSVDDKGVVLILNSHDTKKFAELTSQYRIGHLIFRASNDQYEIMTITIPVTNGILDFTHPESANMAKYLRARFCLAEFKKN